MNMACDIAGGEFCVAWDDDWYRPYRVSRQVSPLIADTTLELAGTSMQHCYKVDTKNESLLESRVGWLAGIAFRRSAWEKHPFNLLAAGGAGSLTHEMSSCMFCS